MLIMLLFVFHQCNLFSQHSLLKNNDHSGVDEAVKPSEIIQNKGGSTIISYSFCSASVDSVLIDGLYYLIVSIDGFGHDEEYGKPNVPGYTEFIPVNNVNPSFLVNTARYVDYHSVNIAPALLPMIDFADSTANIYHFDDSVYSRNAFYPEQVVELQDVQDYCGQKLALVRLHPIQYNPVTKTMRCYYDLSFSSSDIQSGTTDMMRKSAQQSNIVMTNVRDKYIIVTTDNHTQYLADFIDWKESLGYKVDLVSKSSWTSCTEVRDSIKSAYYRDPLAVGKFLFIIGDEEDVPSEIFHVNWRDSTGIKVDKYLSDHYYSCMGDEADYLPELRRGRFLARANDELSDYLSRAKQYEIDPKFLSKGLHVAYFQADASCVKEEREFVFTSEKIRACLLENQAFRNIDRVYRAERNDNPLLMNNGDSIPYDLRRGCYNWSGNGGDVANYANSGLDYILYRGHGSRDGWNNVEFYPEIHSLNCSDKYPLIFSVTCLTGKYTFEQNDGSLTKTTSFANSYTARKNAVGVIASTATSYSGYNETFASGMFANIYNIDNFWSYFSEYLHRTSSFEKKDYDIGGIMNDGFIEIIRKYGFPTGDKHSSSLYGSKETIQRFHFFWRSECGVLYGNRK